ncbi:MAG: glycosyltransferase [Fibrobacteria bacterium]|nr:glycosyltransferase [Fibrobacteria bacterium]
MTIHSETAKRDQRLKERELEIAEYRAKLDPFIGIRMRWRASVARHLFHILPGQTILEIGSGDGALSFELARVTNNACPITDAVFSAQFKDVLEDTLTNQPITVTLLESFPGSLADKKFDYIIAHHLLGNSNNLALLDQIKGILKPGGCLLLFEPNPWNPYLILRTILGLPLRFFFKTSTNWPSLNRIELLSLFSRVGFTNVNALPYDFLYPPIPKKLFWFFQKISLVMENAPYLRNFAGSLMIYGNNIGEPEQKDWSDVLCIHKTLYHKVSFIIPCHNEEMNIPPLVASILSHYNTYVKEIILIDDNSNDNSAETIRDILKKDRRIQLIQRSAPQGVGRALHEGMQQASGNYLVLMDCDFQHLIPELQDLFEAIDKGAQVAIGSRFSRESVLINYAFTKILANRFFHYLIKFFLYKQLRDVSNNLKIMTKEVADNLVIESNGFAANMETGLKPYLLGYQVKEIPVSWINRTIHMGFSDFKMRETGPHFLKMLVTLIKRKVLKQPWQPPCQKTQKRT